MTGNDYTLDAAYMQSAEQKLLYTGNLFTIGFAINSISSGAKNALLIDSKEQDFHLKMEFQSTANMIVRYYRVSSYTPVEPAVLPLNHNARLQDINNLGADLFFNPTIEAMVSSEALWEKLIPGGSSPFAGGGQGSPGQNQIINDGAIGMFELHNIDTMAVSQGLGMVCHETRVSSLDAGI